MDTMALPKLAAQLEDRKALEDEKASIVPDPDETHQPGHDFLIPTSLQSQVRHLLQQDQRDDGLGSPLVLDDERLDSAAGYVGTQNPETAEQDIPLVQAELYHILISPATRPISEWKSTATDDILQITEPHSSVTGLDSETYSVQEPEADEADILSIGTSDIQDGWSSEHNSEPPSAEVDGPTVFSWKEPPKAEPELHPISLKQSASVVTDLGDRVFWADFNATDRDSVAFFNGEDSEDGGDSADCELLVLQDQFFERLVRVHEEKKGFFPRALLAHMVNESCVFDELSKCLKNEHNEVQIREYAKKICEETQLPKDENDHKLPKTRSFKKIFVILVLTEKTSSIIKFLEEDINDLNLPLLKQRKVGSRSRFELRISNKMDVKLECFQNWSTAQIQNFEYWQWTTIAPYFHKGTYKDIQHFPLNDCVMLPFTMDSRRSKGSDLRSEIEGGFSRVFQVVIHPDHHNFKSYKNPYFAVKRLNSPEEVDFKQEVEMLKMFSDDAHPHLISLLATYEQFGVYHLIFPWADGDLNDFWSKKLPKPIMAEKTIRWVAQQCEGIASGLLKIHRYTSNSQHQNGSREKRYGRHGDLTPQNILWFRDGTDHGGTLKICDLGVSEFSTVHSKSYRPKTSAATNRAYRPPESDLKGGQIGQSSDIWSLGCLYLEFITWLLGGNDLINSFVTRRSAFDPMWADMYTDTFFELVECRNIKRAGAIAAMVKPAVTEFIMEELHAHPGCTEFLHDFINMIRLDMLIVKPNNPADKGRISIEQVHVRFIEMLEKCKDLDYLCCPAPWCENSPTMVEVMEVDVSDSAAEVLQRKKFRHYEGPVQERPRSKHLAIPRISRRLSFNV